MVRLLVWIGLINKTAKNKNKNKIRNTIMMFSNKMRRLISSKSFCNRLYSQKKNYNCFHSALQVSKTADSQLLEIGQGGKMLLNFINIAVDVHIKPSWIDHCELNIKSPESSPDLKIVKDYANEMWSITDENIQYSGNESYTLEVVIPEKFNMDASLFKGNFFISDKVEGDCLHLKTSEGNIVAKKLRGIDVQLIASNGFVDVSRFIEGDSFIQTKALRAKLLKGDNIKVNIIDNRDGNHHHFDESIVKINSIYSPSVKIIAEDPIDNSDSSSCNDYKKKIEIDRSHGLIDVKSTCGDIILGGINGIANLQTSFGTIDANFEALEGHSESICLSEKGDINITTSPELSLEVILDSENTIFGKDINFLKKDQLINDNDTNHKSIIEGIITGSMDNNNEENDKSIVAKSGKIDLSGAGAQSLQSFYSQKIPQEQSEMKGNSISKLKATTMSKNGKINFESLGWMDVMKKKFGLEHVNYKNM